MPGPELLSECSLLANSQQIKFASAVAQLINWDTHLVDNGQQQVGHWRIVVILDVTTARFQLARRTTDQDNRQPFIVMSVAVRHTSSIHQHHVVK